MPKYSYVQVIYDSTDDSVTLYPQSLTLEGDNEYVVWWCTTLPEGGSLRVDFPEASGPFQTLSSQEEGALVVGSGNQGRNGCHHYKAYVGSSESGSTLGTIHNLVSGPVVSSPAHCEIRNGPPPVCTPA